jgi:hypothetical protein
MEDLAMIRKLLLFALTCAPVVSSAQDLRSLLTKRYNELNQVIVKRDAAAAEKWVKRYLAPQFLFTSKAKRKYDAEGFLQGLRDQMKLTKQVEHSKVVLGKLTANGAKLSVLVTSDFKGTVSFDKRDLVLTDLSESLDTWVKVGSDWKLKSIVQRKADTQAFHKK